MASVKRLLANPKVRQSYQKRLFRMFDVNPDGLAFSEAYHLVQYLCEAASVELPDPKKVTAVFNSCDKSKTNELNGSEFDAFFEKLLQKIEREGRGAALLTVPRRESVTSEMTDFTATLTDCTQLEMNASLSTQEPLVGSTETVNEEDQTPTKSCTEEEFAKSRSCTAEDLLANAVTQAAPVGVEKERTLAEKIRPYAVNHSWKALKPALKALFFEICDDDDDDDDRFAICSGDAVDEEDDPKEPRRSFGELSLPVHEFELNYEQTRLFFDQVGINHFGLSIADLLDYDIFERFDFDGGGKLNFYEAWKCVKHCLMGVFRRCDDKPPQVVFQTPAQAGYRKTKQIGSGNQAEAWLATSATHGQVALKVFNKSNPNALQLEELIDEMEVMHKLEKCPYVMRQMEIFQDVKCLYSVCELLHGGDLSKFRSNQKKTGQPLTEFLFKKVFKQCVLAIAALHRRAIMHCDIKEENLMMKNTDFNNPHVVLIDFGCSILAAGRGVAGGTPGYRPPETNKTNIWYPTGDIFSMGVVFFQLMADRVPSDDTEGIFQEGAESVKDVIEITASRPVPWQLLSGQYPSAMPWLQRMLEKQRWRRPRAPQLLQMDWFASTELEEQPFVSSFEKACPDSERKPVEDPGVAAIPAKALTKEPDSQTGMSAALSNGAINGSARPCLQSGVSPFSSPRSVSFMLRATPQIESKPSWGSVLSPSVGKTPSSYDTMPSPRITANLAAESVKSITPTSPFTRRGSMQIQTTSLSMRQSSPRTTRAQWSTLPVDTTVLQLPANPPAVSSTANPPAVSSTTNPPAVSSTSRQTAAPQVGLAQMATRGTSPVPEQQGRPRVATSQPAPAVGTIFPFQARPRGGTAPEARIPSFCSGMVGPQALLGTPIAGITGSSGRTTGGGSTSLPMPKRSQGIAAAFKELPKSVSLENPDILGNDSSHAGKLKASPRIAPRTDNPASINLGSAARRGTSVRMEPQGTFEKQLSPPRGTPSISFSGGSGGAIARAGKPSISMTNGSRGAHSKVSKPSMSVEVPVAKSGKPSISLSGGSGGAIARLGRPPTYQSGGVATTVRRGISPSSTGKAEKQSSPLRGISPPRPAPQWTVPSSVHLRATSPNFLRESENSLATAASDRMKLMSRAAIASTDA